MKLRNEATPLGLEEGTGHFGWKMLAGTLLQMDPPLAENVVSKSDPIQLVVP
jgi:hypothetical protein